MEQATAGTMKRIGRARVWLGMTHDQLDKFCMEWVGKFFIDLSEAEAVLVEDRMEFALDVRRS